MKHKKILLVITFILGGLILSACGGRSLQASSWPGLTVKGDLLYVAYTQQVHAIKISSGVEQTSLPNEIERSSPQVFAAPAFFDDDNMILGTYSNSVVNLNPSTGVENWTFENTNRFIATPLIFNDMIYAPNSDHKLYALNSGGTVVWTFEAEKPIWSTPATDGEKLYVGAMDHFLYALKPDSGNMIWKTDLGGTTVGSPAIGENGKLYIGTFESEVYEVDSATGRLGWRFPTKGWVWAGPVLADGVLYITDLDGYLYAVDAETGDPLWQFKGEGAAPGSPLIQGDSIYFTTSNGILYAINMEGGVRWTFQTENEDAQFYAPPVFSQDLILIGVVDGDQLVIAVDTNGASRWEYFPE